MKEKTKVTRLINDWYKWRTLGHTPSMDALHFDHLLTLDNNSRLTTTAKRKVIKRKAKEYYKR